MPHQTNRLLLAVLAIFVGLGLSLPNSVRADDDAAEALFKENDCHKCHHATKSKKGPSLAKIAEKYKGKPDSEAKMLEHMSKGGKVKLDDGTEEDHKVIGTKDIKAKTDVAKWMLNR
jgi:cytochrome c